MATEWQDFTVHNFMDGKNRERFQPVMWKSFEL